MENFKGTTGEWSININDTGHITSVRSVQAGRTIFTSKVNNLEESNANMKLALHSKEMLELMEYFLQKSMLSVEGEVLVKKLIEKINETI